MKEIIIMVLLVAFTSIMAMDFVEIPIDIAKEKIEPDDNSRFDVSNFVSVSEVTIDINKTKEVEKNVHINTNNFSVETNAELDIIKKL